MFLWIDRENQVDLVEIDGKNVHEHELFAKYDKITITEGHLHFWLVNGDPDIFEEEYKYKNIEDYSWKVRGLEFFHKVMQNKGININNRHAILTSVTDSFTYQKDDYTKLLIAEIVTDEDGFLLCDIVDTFDISLSYNSMTAFTNGERYEQFIPSMNDDIIEASKEFLAWYEAGKPCQSIELLSMSMIAARFGKQRQNVYKYFKNGKLPAPFAFADNTPYWHKKQLGALAQIFETSN